MEQLSEHEALRAEFEADAYPLGFDFKRLHGTLGGEPWAEYESAATGHRWAGFVAARASLSVDAQELAYQLIDKWLGLGPDGEVYVRAQLAAAAAQSEHAAHGIAAAPTPGEKP
jgi:hypothetical protein